MMKKQDEKNQVLIIKAQATLVSEIKKAYKTIKVMSDTAADK